MNNLTTMDEHRRKHSKKPASHIEMFRANWWMIAFLSVMGVFAWQSSQKKQLVIADLQSRLSSVVQERAIAALEHEDLLLQISGQNDPEWVELILMRRLGLVPEGQVKVYFEKRAQ